MYLYCAWIFLVSVIKCLWSLKIYNPNVCYCLQIYVCDCFCAFYFRICITREDANRCVSRARKLIKCCMVVDCLWICYKYYTACTNELSNPGAQNPQTKCPRNDIKDNSQILSSRHWVKTFRESTLLAVTLATAVHAIKRFVDQKLQRRSDFELKKLSNREKGD